ncbi:MAG: cob(I)yrinic acid a,c-diamide adenosyltransferase, partial [Candidatus Peregrinibacteria bacterium]
MILVLTGNGKGKTTSALGTALRAAGWGQKTAIVFFDKGGDYYGEQQALEGLRDRIDVFRFGLPRFDEAGKSFRLENTAEDAAQAKAALEKVRELLSGGYFLVIADELLNALRLGLVDEASVREAVE